MKYTPPTQKTISHITHRNNTPTKTKTTAHTATHVLSQHQEELRYTFQTGADGK